MRKFLCVSISCFVCGLANVYATSKNLDRSKCRLSATLSSDVEKKAKVAATVSSRHRQRLLRKTLADQISQEIRTISWRDFQQQSIYLQEREKNKRENYRKGMDDLAKNKIEDFVALQGIHTWQNQRPDYAEESKNFKYIYIADGSRHGTRTIPAEVNFLLQSIRNINPDARILLALEFAMRRDKREIPLYFAGDKKLPFYLHPSYASLRKTADKNQIDILGLDDYLQHKGQLVLQIGSLHVNPDEEAQDIIQSYHQINPDLSDNQILYDFLSRSAWGIEQRNTQWMQYIQALAPFYDIIVVYAGNAHVDEEIAPVTPLPQRIAQPYIFFKLYTNEEITPQEQAFYTTADKVQQKTTGSFSRTAACPERQNALWNQVWNTRPNQWDMSKPFYQKIVLPDLEQRSDLSNAMKKEIHAFLNQHALEPDIPAVIFSINLPDYTRWDLAPEDVRFSLVEDSFDNILKRIQVQREEIRNLGTITYSQWTLLLDGFTKEGQAILTDETTSADTKRILISEAIQKFNTGIEQINQSIQRQKDFAALN